MGLDVFSERIEAKADKQMLANALNAKVGRQEFEQAMASKSDRMDIDMALRNIQVSVEEELGSLNEQLSRKSNLEDIEYFAKELSFKLDKGELEAFRQDFVDRIAAFEGQLLERNQLLRHFGEALESKVEGTLIENSRATDEKLFQRAKIA